MAGSTRQFHELKAWPEAFQLTWDEVKPFDIRRNDRGFRTDDILTLREWDPDTGKYSGRWIWARVTCVVEGQWGLPEGVAVLGIEVLDRRGEQGE